MRDRLNVRWHGKRTTARFPPELWALALRACDYQEGSLRRWVSETLAHNEKPAMDDYTASGIVRQCLMQFVYHQITPAGFNPGPEKRESETRSV